MTRYWALSGVRRYAAPSTILVATYIAMVVASPGFGGESAVYAVLESFTLVGLLALGVAVTMLAGELDLAVGSIAAVAAIVAIQAASAGTTIAILVAVIVGTAYGCLSGFLIARLGISSLMLTVGSLIMLRGVAFVISDNQPVVLSDPTLALPFIERYGVLSLGSIIALAVFLAIWIFLSFTRPGRYLYATGGAPHEARAAGVPVVASTAMAFAISGGCAALAGAVAAFQGGSAAPSNYSDVLLPAVAAALVGGVALKGGEGTVVNVALGVITLGIIGAGLSFRGTDSAVASIVQGVVLVVVLTFEFLALRVWTRRRALGTTTVAPA